MKLFTKYGTRSNEIRRAKREFFTRLALVGFVFFFFAIMILITRLSPRLSEEERRNLPQASNQGDPLTNPVLVRMRGEVAELENKYLHARRMGQGSMDDLAILEQAIEIQNQIIRHRGSTIPPQQDLDKLDTLQTHYDQQMGEFLRAQSDRLEEEAIQAWELNQLAEAIEKLTAATNLQRQINNEHGRSDYRSATRLRQLEGRLLGWTTRPIAQRIDMMKDQATIAARAGSFAEALEKIAQAIEQQNELNRNYRDSRYASVFRLRELEDIQRHIRLTRDLTEVRGRFSRAQAALENETPAAAIAIAEEAELMLLRIAEAFPRDRDQFAELESDLHIFKDTAGATEIAAQIIALEGLITDSLRRQSAEGLRNTLSDWRRLALDMQRRFPRSEQLAQVNFAKIEYLHGIRENIPAIMDAVYRNLEPIPGQTDEFLFIQEVSQSLYQMIMGSNPSQNQNPQLPVESVTWIEASQFTQRLSWVLAWPVQLPQRHHYQQALGMVPRDLSPDTVWSMENTDRITRPTGTSEPNNFGFHDLLGNVAEWLGTPTSGTPQRVVAFGGSVRDSRTRLSAVPEEARGPGERNRFVGFRFIVIKSANAQQS